MKHSLPLAPRQFRLELSRVVVTLLSAVSILIIATIFVFIFVKAAPVMGASGLGLIFNSGFDRQIQETFYAPPDAPMLVFGLSALIVGTLLSSGLALLFATVLGVGAAVAICEYCGRKVAALFTNVVRLLAAIPSVIYGLIGMITVVPLVEALFVTPKRQIAFLDFFQMSGRNLLSSVIVLTFMIVPTVVSLSADAIAAVPDQLRACGHAFGMSKFRIIWKIVLPSARSGITAGVLLGAGRGIGEAIAVSMVCGGVGILPRLSFGLFNLMAPTLPLSAAIINKSEAMGSGPVANALFACGALLLVFGTVLSVTARLISRRLVKGGAAA
jgi:phosphate ABC transporter permease protein PstC